MSVIALEAWRGSSAEMDPVFRSQQTECNATDSLDGALQMQENIAPAFETAATPFKDINSIYLYI